MKKTGFIVLVLIISLPVSFYVFLHLKEYFPSEEREKREAIAERNIERGFIEISIDDIPLKIPIEFVPRQQAHFDGERSSFGFGLKYSNYQPNPKVFGQIYVNIQKKHEYIGKKKVLEVWGLDLEGQEWKFGLTYHPPKRKIQNNALKFYSFKFDQDDRLNLSCGGICYTKYYRGLNDVDIYYRYSVDQLENWREIHDHVVGLVKNFIEGAKTD